MQKELTKNNLLKLDDYIQQLFVTNFLNFCFYESYSQILKEEFPKEKQKG